MKVTDDSYIINGKHYVRVTKVLDIIAKPELLRWIGKHGLKWCDDYKDERAAFGTRVHKEIQNYLEGRDVWIDDREMRKSLNLFRTWDESHNINPMFLEHHVRSEKYKYAGTVDFIGSYDGVLSIIDWKTAKYIYDHYSLQLAAYWMAFEEQYPGKHKIEQAIIVSIRDGKIKKVVIKRDKILELFEYFLCARKLYEWKYKK